jgi:hypothetical protein
MDPQLVERLAQAVRVIVEFNLIAHGIRSRRYVCAVVNERGHAMTSGAFFAPTDGMTTASAKRLMSGNSCACGMLPKHAGEEIQRQKPPCVPGATRLLREHLETSSQVARRSISWYGGNFYR